MTMNRAFTSNAILDCMTTGTFRFHHVVRGLLINSAVLLNQVLEKK
jgi:hypothetical protein